jgi:hypothetical protein
MVESFLIAIIYYDYSTKYDIIPVDSPCIISTSDICFIDVSYEVNVLNIVNMNY